ncbi:MAG: ribonuclease HI [Oscillospiraceae bacterium]|jgi:ribonuclease HI|nr:ribonuclease HI [Oscillospiraceae bacterium]
MPSIFTRKKVKIFTDGACLGNPGPGGWGAVLKCCGVEREIFGAEKNTTNNRMELMAVIMALQELKYPCVAEVYSDSKYVCDAVSKGWVRTWQEKNWKKSNGEKALNIDLWKKLLELLSIHDVVFFWVKGHSGLPENERCDVLATTQAKKLR